MTSSNLSSPFGVTRRQWGRKKTPLDLPLSNRLRSRRGLLLVSEAIESVHRSPDGKSNVFRVVRRSVPYQWLAGLIWRLNLVAGLVSESSIRRPFPSSPYHAGGWHDPSSIPRE